MAECSIKLKLKEWQDYRGSEWSANKNPEIWAKITDIMTAIKTNTTKSREKAAKLREELVVMVEGQKGKTNRLYKNEDEEVGAMGDRNLDAERAYKDRNKPKPVRIDGFEKGSNVKVRFRGTDKAVTHVVESTEKQGNYITLKTNKVTATFNIGQDRSTNFIKEGKDTGNYVVVDGIGKAGIANIKGSDESMQIGGKEGDNYLGGEQTDLGDALANDFNGYYEYDVKEGKEIKTQEFADLQNQIVATYQKTMRELDSGNVTIEMFDSEVNQTAGQINLDTNEMRIRWNKLSRMSRVSEVFLHEVNHLMSSHVFAENPKLRKLMEELRDEAVDSGVTYKVFLDGIADPTQNEIALAKEKFEYIFDKTSNIEEFYAYATTNENVYNGIKDAIVKTPLIKVIELDNAKKQPFKKVLNTIIETINKVWRLLSGRGVRGGQMIADMVNTIARLDAEMAYAKAEEQAAELESGSISSYAKGKMNQLDEAVKPAIDKVEEWTEALSNKSNKNKLGKLIEKIPVLNDLMATGISQYVWRMVTQDTTKENVADMYMVFRHAKQEIEKHTSKITNGVKTVANEYYKDVDEPTKNAVKSIIMESDLAQFNVDEIVKYLEDENELNAEIAKLEKEVYITDELVTAKDKREQVEGLANYLVTGKTKVHNQQINANNIATNLMGILPRKTTTAEIKAIDKLISLKALKLSDTVHKNNLLDLTRTESGKEALESTINMYRGYIDNMRDDATIGFHDPIQKGYTRAEEGLTKYELIPKSEVKAQESVLMKLVQTEPYAIVDGKEYYLMTGAVKSVGFKEGGLGLISHTTDGISLAQLIRKNNEIKGKEEIGESELKKYTRKIIKELADGNVNTMRKFKLSEDQALIPVYDHQNKIIDYRVQLTKLEKEMYQPDRKTELVDVMSNTFSRSIKTSLTALENRKVIDAIFAHTARGVLENPDDYILVEEYTDEDRFNGVKYEKRHDRWKHLPDHTKDYIYKKNRSKGILVHKDFVELMMGEKEVTVGNFNKFGVNIKKYPVARARLMALEAYMSEVSGYVKNAMIVLNSDVLLGNQTSNAMVAVNHGIDPVKYVKKFKKRWDELDEYNRDVQLMAELEVRQMAGEKVDVKIHQLQKQLEDNRWDELVKDGQYTALVEDINVEGQGEGYLLTRAKGWLEKNNWLEATENVKNGLYINRTSGVYNTLLKTVHYGDAITRQIIKEELEERAIKAQGQLTDEMKQEILNYLDQLLVNYGYVMNRWWDYADRVAELFFMKYYMSQAKAIASMSKKNPTKTALLQGAQYVTGLDVQDPIDTYLRSGMAGISYRWMLDDAVEELANPNILDLIPGLSSIVRIE